MDDSKDKAIPCFIAAADLIHRELSQHGKVCINCGNGNSRTAFALMTYLIRHQSFSWTEASEFVSAGQAERSDIDFKLRTEGPNGSYCEWIESSIKKITGEKTTDYIGGHVKLTSKSDANKSVFSVVPNASKKRRRKADEQQEALSLETLRPRKIRKTAEARMLEEAHAFIGNGFDRYQLRSGEFYGES